LLKPRPCLRDNLDVQLRDVGQLQPQRWKAVTHHKTSPSSFGDLDAIGFSALEQVLPHVSQNLPASRNSRRGIQ
jgi:hypothetical protein